MAYLDSVSSSPDGDGKSAYRTFNVEYLSLLKLIVRRR